MNQITLGDTWFVKIPDTSLGAEAVVKVAVLDVTEKTVLLKWVSTDTWNEENEEARVFQGRFTIDDVFWVEQII